MSGVDGGAPKSGWDTGCWFRLVAPPIGRSRLPELLVLPMAVAPPAPPAPHDANLTPDSNTTFHDYLDMHKQLGNDGIVVTPECVKGRAMIVLAKRASVSL